METTANEDLLKRVVKRIERDREHWNQNTWGRIGLSSPIWKQSRVEIQWPKIDKPQPVILFDNSSPLCGTTFCLAGHTVLEEGDSLVFDHQGLAYYCVTHDTKEIVTIEDRAAELLGLDEDQADQLFEARNYDLECFKDVITEVTGVEFD